MRLIITNLKHFLFTFTLLILLTLGIAVSYNADIDYGDNPLAYKVGNEGPHIFFENGQTIVNHIRGDRKKGFSVEEKRYSSSESFKTNVHFTLENNEFEIEINPIIEVPEVTYNDNQPILAISDIESGFKTFRDFLIANKVIDTELNWTFGKGHLVLNGDFVDRGFSTTQVLWFIYKLEQTAKSNGGYVHFILGNHEIKNLQGNYQKAAYKYFHIASILGKQQHELFGENSFIGRWLASKNTLELINGYLFVHGGIHPDITKTDLSLDQINQFVRTNYVNAYFPKPNADLNNLLLSTRKGPSWYRGYFENKISQQDVELGLKHFNAKVVVVGHQPQWYVNQLYEGKVIAINVKHPRDYRGSFPPRRSEGLLIQNGEKFRIRDDGSKELL